jgi:hypothetical protein
MAVVDEPEAVLWASVFADGPGGGNPAADGTITATRVDGHLRTDST